METREVFFMIGVKSWIPVAGAVVGLSAFGGLALAAPANSSVLLKSQLFGNIPSVTVRGVAAATAPWVVDGHLTLTRTHLSASGTWLVIPQGYTATGAQVPKSLVGTTAGVPKLVADITDAQGKDVITAPVTLSKNGAFSFNVALNLTGPIGDPVVLIGPPGKKAHSIDAWFAATNFLKQYGDVTPSMIKSWTHSSSSGSSSYGAAKTGSSGSSKSKSSGGWN